MEETINDHIGRMIPPVISFRLCFCPPSGCTEGTCRVAIEMEALLCDKDEGSLHGIYREGSYCTVLAWLLLLPSAQHGSTRDRHLSPQCSIIPWKDQPATCWIVDLHSTWMGQWFNLARINTYSATDLYFLPTLTKTIIWRLKALFEICIDPKKHYHWPWGMPACIYPL